MPPRIAPIRLRYLFSVNCYLVSAGDGHVLIDSGMVLPCSYSCWTTRFMSLPDEHDPP